MFWTTKIMDRDNLYIYIYLDMISDYNILLNILYLPIARIEFNEVIFSYKSQ